MKEEDINNLISRYKQMLASGKSVYFDPVEYETLADYYEAQDDYETASEVVQHGLVIHPESESLMLKFARYLTYDAKYEEALEYINLHIGGDDPELQLIRIECLLQTDNAGEAAILADKLLSEADSDLDVILSELGFIYLDAEEFDSAILFLKKSLEFNSENKEVLNDLIYAYEARNEFALAIDICNSLLDIDPYSFETWTMLGRLYFMGNDIQKAIESFDFALSINDSDVPTLKMKAHCLLMTDQINESVEILEQCCVLVPDDEMLYLSLADCFLQLDKLDLSLINLNKYESLIGETSISLAKKAYIFQKQKMNEAAALHIAKALEADPESYDVNMIAGDMYFEAGMFDDAGIHYSKAMDLNDYKDEAKEKLIAVYIQNKRYDEAIKLQKGLTLTNPTNVAFEKLALLYMEIGDEENYEICINSFGDDVLRSFFLLLFPEYQEKIAILDKEFIMARLKEAFDSRLFYKNSKY